SRRNSPARQSRKVHFSERIASYMGFMLPGRFGNSETKRREIGVPVVPVFALGALEEVHCTIRERRERDLDQGLSDPLREHQHRYQLVRYQAAVPECQRIEQQRIDTLAYYCRADRTRPQMAPRSADLHLRQHERVDELAA